MPKKKETEKKPKATKAKATTKKAAAKTAEEPAKKKVKTPELLRGFRDILPDEQGRFNAIRDVARGIAEAYSFDRIDLPILERTDLFNRTIGKGTDILEKEMYVFTDPSNRSVALRPEATASAARAYINHGMLERPQPVKMYYEGPMFRHDRPQAGRYRQFYQIGFESFGVKEPIVDAQLIFLGYSILRDLGLNVKVKINSIGTSECRQAYLAELVAYMRPHRSKLGDDDKRRLQKNPLRLLDSKDPTTIELLEGAPQILDWLDDKSKDHFMRVLEFLEEVEVPFDLNPNLVRGLDYYTHTVFEYVLADDEGKKAQNALGGGGRYDGLVEQLGGREETPGCGLAIGIERVARAMDAAQIDPPQRPQPSVFFAQLGDAARRVGMRLFEDFRQSGIPVAEAFGKNSLKAQLEAANKIGVQLTLILGQKEVLDQTIIIRDMESGAQEIVDAKKVVSIVTKKLNKDEGVVPKTYSPVAPE